MGLSFHHLLNLISLRTAGHLAEGASVIEIGSHQLSNEFLRGETEIAELYRLYGRTPVDLGRSEDAGFIDGMERLPDAAPPARPFWESLGFHYAAIEYNGHRDSIALDLNRDTVPRDLRSKFDLAVNAGTTEHVANQDNAFRVIHDLVKPGGIMMHFVPAGGMLTHGLVAYNMQFFWLLCRENKYVPLHLYLNYLGPLAISQDVIGSNATYGHFGHGLPIPSGLTVPGFTIHAVLQKPAEREYVSMLDVPEAAL